MSASRCLLRLSRLRVPVRLGWTNEERAREQWVSLGIELRLDHVPSACVTDELAGTIDYATIGELARRICQRTEYRLIERLAGSLHQELGEGLPPWAQLRISVTKERPPVPGLEGGATFVLGGWEDEADS